MTLLEFVAQSCVSMYCNLWNIHKVTSHYFSDCSLDQGTFKKQTGSYPLNVPRVMVHGSQLASECPSNYSTLQTSSASRNLTPTGGPCKSNSEWTSCLDTKQYRGNEVKHLNIFFHDMLSLIKSGICLLLFTLELI